MSEHTPGDFYRLMEAFTSEGTPLKAIIGSKAEQGVIILAAGMLANHNLASTMTPEELADASISYYHCIQARLGEYQNENRLSLEKLL